MKTLDLQLVQMLANRSTSAEEIVETIGNILDGRELEMNDQFDSVTCNYYDVTDRNDYEYSLRIECGYNQDGEEVYSIEVL